MTHGRRGTRRVRRRRLGGRPQPARGAALLGVAGRPDVDPPRPTNAGSPMAGSPAIAAGPGGFVAVGTVGPVGHPTTSAVWTSADGVDWQRVADAPALAAGRDGLGGGRRPGLRRGRLRPRLEGGPRLALRGRTHLGARPGPGLARRTTASGSRWPTSSPDPDRLVAVGHFLFGQQFGQGTAWTSPDGRTWTRMPDQASFGQGEPQAVIPDGSGLRRDRDGRRAGQLHPDGLAQPRRGPRDARTLAARGLRREPLARPAARPAARARMS